MSTPAPFYTTEDSFANKWRILITLGLTGLAAAIYFGTDEAVVVTQRNLAIASANYSEAAQSVASIGAEIDTIRAYAASYEELDSNRVLGDEDRLLLLETVTDIRSRNYLYPIALEVGAQTQTRLIHEENQNGGESVVMLNTSVVQLGLPLLHEGDLINFLADLMNDSGLFQMKECSLALRDTGQTEFTALFDNQVADCDLFWHTIDVSMLE